MRVWQIVLALCLAAFSGSVLIADVKQDETQAISKIKLLGGKVTTDDKLPGHPVVDVRFDWSNRIDDKYTHLLKEFPDLATLSLFRTRISDDGLQALRELTSLTMLDLGGCPRITDAGLRELRGLKNLTSLSLRETEITDDGIRELGAFERLTVLNLYGCRRITDMCVRQLGENRSLKLLYLGRTQVTVEGLKGLSGLKALTYLDLTGTSVDDAGMEDLRRSFGGPQIVNRAGEPVPHLPVPAKRRLSLDLITSP